MADLDPVAEQAARLLEEGIDFLGAFHMEPTAADVAAWLAAQPQEVARAVVRAQLARDPEAAAKVAEAWVRDHGYHSARHDTGGRVVAGVNQSIAAAGGWLGWSITNPGAATRHATRAEAEAAVDALLTADGWTLGVGDAG